VPPERRVLSYKGVVLELTADAFLRPTPEVHADALLSIMMHEFGGKKATPRVIETRYLDGALAARLHPYPWQMVLLPFHRRLREIYGSKAYRGWASAPVMGGTKVRVRTVRIPTLGEFEAAQAARQNPDTIVAMHQRGG
jgi:hypothetical protein